MNKRAIEILKQFEGFREEAYKCPAGVLTIGYGSTHYMDGSPVKKGDKLKSKDEAVELLKMMVKKYEDDLAVMNCESRICIRNGRYHIDGIAV